MTNHEPPALQVDNLRVYYWTARGPVKAVDDISFTINRNERFGFIGESGCGKTTTIMAILRLIKRPGKIESGRIVLNGRDLVALDKEEMRQVRWNKISLIPQGAMNSLNPIMRVRDQIADTILTHKGSVETPLLREEINGLLDMVELPAKVADMYPHELSGGMKQRVCIAMATALEPELIIADEPTSALDVVVQKAVMQTLIGVQERLGASMILIGHDMGLTAQVLDRVGVMYAGKLVEVAPIRELYRRPQHPYTQALISSLPSVREKKRGGGIPGLPPFLLNPPPGCLFRTRCPHAFEPCQTITPPLRAVQPGHLAACHLYEPELQPGLPQSHESWKQANVDTPL
ncbi:MAG: dipeptide/oligopeptide/nickel ABC transporter ATP-binding protein [Chloroflexi bacterium]|nr:MAG: dipeptide/oligopeptide/nickel ABC transporter ATP-binding protein [Chloroflexota bacterium]